MSNKPILICMVGLPRSGKTTWAREQGVPIVSGDAIRLALHGKRFLQDAEPMVHAIAHYMVPALFNAGHDCVIVDECNVSQKRRDEWMSDKWATVFHYIDTSKEECLERAKNDNDDEIIPVIERMASEFDFYQKAFWK